MPARIARHTPALTGKRRVRALSLDEALFPDISDALTQVTFSEQWEEVGSSVGDVVEECSRALGTWYSDMLVGTVAPFMVALPSGWLLLDGATYDEVDYPELYAVLDVVFKNEPAETFTLPDVSGLVFVSVGAGLGMGDLGGAASVALSVAEMPVHSHSYVPPVVDIDLELAGVPDTAAARLGPPAQTGSAGSGDAHENMPPYLALRYGVFSGRG